LKERILFRFARFQNQIKSIAIHITDLNGPKGGIDKRCVVIIEGDGLEKIVVTSEAGQSISALDSAAVRAKSALQQALRKRRRQMRGKESIRKLLGEAKPIFLED